MVIAPLTALFPLWLLKAINVLAVAGGCFVFWRTLRARCGETAATIFLLTFLCLSDVLFVWRTTTHSLSLAYILAGASLLAAGLRRNWTPASLIVLSAALGSGFNFIDFLVNPPLMPMLIAFFVLLSERRDAGLLAIAAVLGLVRRLCRDLAREMGHRLSQRGQSSRGGVGRHRNASRFAPSAP